MRKRIATIGLVLCLLLSASPVALAAELPGGEYAGDFFTALFESMHTVMLAEGFSGDILVADGQDYTFRAEDDSYTYTIMAYMDGAPVNAVDNGDGSFTIRNVTGSLLIGARKIPKPPQPAPQPMNPQPTPAPNPTPTPQPAQPQPVPETPAEEPEVIPDVPVEEVVQEEPKPVEPTPEKEEKPVKPAAPAEPVPEVVEEKEPFPWWIPALAVLGLGMIAAIVLLLSRRTVVFAVDGGTETKAQKILKGRMAARPREPERAGSVFAGWFTDEARTKRWDFENAKVENHMILYAKWLAA